MRQIIAAALIVASLLVVNTEAWWCTGHMVIAEIARQNLNPGVEAQVNERFSFLNKWFPQSNNMVAGACWADDLKSQSLEVMAGWHFINQVYNPENVPVTIKNWPMQKINVETAIADLDRTMRSTNVNDWISAYAVANLVHFIGDIHQPLHATDRFNPTFPDGDRGGNLIKVWWAQKEWPLHFIWDSVCGLYTEEPNRPLDQADQTYITNLANQYQANFSIPSDDKKTWNSTVMALESYEAAIKYSYANNTITNNQTLTQSYVDTCKTVAGYRIAAAGYRLAHELNYIFYRPPSAGAILNRIKEARDEFHRAVGGRAAERRSSP